MTTITINGPGFSFSAQFEHLSASAAQGIAFDAMKALVAADRNQKSSSVFDVVLTGFIDGRKINTIKEIRAATGLGLKEAKDMSEDLPATVLRKITAQEAAGIQKAFEAAGAVMNIVPAKAESDHA